MTTLSCFKIWAAAARFLFPIAMYSQTVIQPWEVPCGEEKVQPNLELKMEHHITGKLKDQSGAPFVKSKVLLQTFRDKEKSATFKQVITDDEGHFDFGMVGPGKYRFLPSPTRAFKQPKHVDCFESSKCELNLELEINPTDQEFANCPIQ